MVDINARVVLFLLCAGGVAVSEFQVRDASEAETLDLRIDNTDLLESAARIGENHTVPVLMESQLIIAQDRVFLLLDCSSLLSFCDPECNVIWRRQLGPDEPSRILTPGSNPRFQFRGPSNSILYISPTNIIQGGERADSGDYNCTVCRTMGPMDTSTQGVCLTRLTTLFLLGSRPTLQEPEGCEMKSSDWMACKAGDELRIPSTIDPDTGGRSLSISRLTITCDPDIPVLPAPTYTWTKDGVVVFSSDVHGNSNQMLDDRFLMQGNNSFLLLISPAPLQVTSFIILIDFTGTGFIMSNNNMTNMMSLTSLPDGGTSSEDIQRFITETVLGIWQCCAVNAFGSNCYNSTVIVDPLNCANDCQNCSEPGVCVEVDSRCQCIVSPVPLNCTNGCRNCSEPGVCVEIDSRCQCTCPVGYTMRTHSFSSCEGNIDECANSTEVGVVSDDVERLVCLREQEPSGCGKSCYLPIAIVGVILLLLLLVLVAMIIGYRIYTNLSHGYVITA